MQTSEESLRRILSLSRHVVSPDAADARQAVAEAKILEADLRQDSELWFSGIPSAGQVAVGLRLAEAAIGLGVATKAMETVVKWEERRKAEPDLAARVAAINCRVARRQIMAALAAVSFVDHSEASPAPPDQNEQGADKPSMLEQTPVPQDELVPNLGALRNIASFHREHERHYTQAATESAVDLYREANRLRIVAGIWLQESPPPALGGVDFADPRYQAVGCTDLNAFSAIPAIGILFMEGEGEPAEIRGIKAKLKAQASAAISAGQWLSSKMDAAWVREQSVYSHELIDAAQPRLNTIVTNWRGSREMHLRGRLIGFVLAHLERIDFRPQSIRAARIQSGRRLLDAAWILVMAAQLSARSAADLGESDRNWTAYLDILAARAASR